MWNFELFVKRKVTGVCLFSVIFFCPRDDNIKPIVLEDREMTHLEGNQNF